MPFYPALNEYDVDSTHTQTVPGDGRHHYSLNNMYISTLTHSEAAINGNGDHLGLWRSKSEQSMHCHH